MARLAVRRRKARAYADRALRSAANILLVAERSGQVTAARVAEVVEALVDLRGAVESAPLEETLGGVVDLARTQRLAACDASYLDLAMRPGLSLATQDRDLRASADRVGVASFALNS